MNILLYIIIVPLLIITVAINLLFFAGIPAVIIWKIYRSLRYRISLYD